MTTSTEPNAALSLRSSVRALWRPQTVARLVIALACFELVARLAPWIVPATVHQPFLVSTRQVDAVTDREGMRTVTWKTNERGARGSLYRAQPYEIAVFGSSTTAGSLLDQAEAWPSRLAAAAPCLHVDSYARDGATLSDAIQVLAHLDRAGRRYDAVVIMQHADPKRVELESSLQFWGQWTASGVLHGPLLAFRHALLQIAKEKRLASIRAWLFPRAIDRHDDNDIRNWEYRQSPRVQLVYEPYSMDPEVEKRVTERATELFTTARRVTNAALFVNQPVAFDEAELPEVGRRWYSLYPSRHTPHAYLNNRSIAEQIRYGNRVLESAARAKGVPIVQLDEYIRPLLRVRGDLFVDKWHFSRHGAAITAERVRAELEKHGISCIQSGPAKPTERNDVARRKIAPAGFRDGAP